LRSAWAIDGQALQRGHRVHDILRRHEALAPAIQSSGAALLTVTVSVAAPNCRVTSTRIVVATWTWIPGRTYFWNPP